MEIFSYFEKVKEEYNVLEVDKRDIMIWGMGYVDALYQNAFRFDGTQIKYYISKDQKGVHNGIEIITPSEILKKSSNPLILICAQNKETVESIENDINSLSSHLDHIMITKYFFGKYMDEVFANLENLDTESARVYSAIIKKMIENDTDASELWADNHYFAVPCFFAPNPKEVYLDMGGYVGDSLEEYLFKKHGAFERYYVFEPDLANFEALKRRINRINSEWNFKEDKIIAECAGIGRETKELFFDNRNSANSSFSSSETGVKQKIWSIDDYFKEIKVGVIKADIEGFELEMLMGAEKIICRDRPKMCISIYHNAYDMIFIPKWIRNLNMDYSLCIKQHGVVLDDTVLYAY